jgi:hypothetical protein
VDVSQPLPLAILGLAQWATEKNGYVGSSESCSFMGSTKGVLLVL